MTVDHSDGATTAAAATAMSQGTTTTITALPSPPAQKPVDSSHEKREDGGEEEGEFTLSDALPADAPAIAKLGADTFSAAFGWSMPAADLAAYLAEAYVPAVIEAEIRDPRYGIRVVRASSSSSSGGGKGMGNGQNGENGENGEIVAFAQLARGESDKCLAGLGDGDGRRVEKTTVGAEAAVAAAAAAAPAPAPATSGEPAGAAGEPAGGVQGGGGGGGGGNKAPPPRNPAHAMLKRVYASPATAGKGLGTRLVAELVETARREGFRYLWLTVWEENKGAQRLYGRFGFEKMGEYGFTMGECTQVDWVMVKKL